MVLCISIKLEAWYFPEDVIHFLTRFHGYIISIIILVSFNFSFYIEKIFVSGTCVSYQSILSVKEFSQNFISTSLLMEIYS